MFDFLSASTEQLSFSSGVAVLNIILSFKDNISEIRPWFYGTK